jgi:hypothetical protein
MGTLITFPAPTPQERADAMLREWQRHRDLKPEQRLEAHDAYERDLEVLRQLMERSR